MSDGKNIILYWDTATIPPDVAQVCAAWRAACPDWQVRMFDASSARSFLLSEYGETIASMFDTCAMPAMRADLLRIFAALSFGGIYCDITFMPKAAPPFQNEGKELTLVRWDHGRIVNGIFHAKRGSHLLKQVGFEVLIALSRRRSNNIWEVTGPGAWIRALTDVPTEQYTVVEYAPLFAQHVSPSHYTSSTRNTERHWSKLQEVQSIYC